jgi:dTDP-4-amino-4,6-dideoxygalactose transaminase
MHRPIAISLSPNTEKDDIRLASKIFLFPWRWRNNKDVKLFEKEFAKKFGKKDKAIAVNSGRSALYLILKALGVGEGDEVALQAFTCVAVPNSVIWAGARPKYIDIDASYNLDPEDFKRKIGERTKAVIVQHTFGIPAKTDAIREIAKQKNILLIEDCSHALGLTINGRKAGTLGDVSFFSFGRDKVLSSVFGGVVLCSNEALHDRIRAKVDEIANPNLFWVVQQLFHPVAMSLILPTYKLGLGKALLYFFQKIGFLSRAVYKLEKFGGRPRYFPQKFPGGLALLALNQLAKLERYNKHRGKISSLYFQSLRNSGVILPPDKPGSIWLRFPVRHPNSTRIFKYAKNRGILLGDWYKGILPPCTTLEKVFYMKGSCPKAEEYAETILNLPTYPTLSEKEARKVVTILKEWENLRKR